MPSIKQTLILLPLVGLAASAPTNFPRDLETPYKVAGFEATNAYHVNSAWGQDGGGGGGGNNEDAAGFGGVDPDDNGADNDMNEPEAVQRRAEPQRDSWFRQSFELGAETVGRFGRHLWEGSKGLFDTVKSGGSHFLEGVDQGAAKRDVYSSALVDTGAEQGLTKTKRNLGKAAPAPEHGGINPGFGTNIPAATQPQRSFLSSAVKAYGDFSNQRNNNAMMSEVERKAKMFTELEAMARKQDIQKQQRLADQKAKDWERENTLLGATKQRVISWVMPKNTNQLGVNTPPMRPADHQGFATFGNSDYDQNDFGRGY